VEDRVGVYIKSAPSFDEQIAASETENDASADDERANESPKGDIRAPSKNKQERTDCPSLARVYLFARVSANSNLQRAHIVD
jgi:hypothetical protein